MDDFQYEKLYGKEQFDILGFHGDKDVVAMQVYANVNGQNTFRSALWSTETGRVIWMPEGAVTMTWLQHGMEVALVKEVVRDHGAGKGCHDRYEYFWERYSWPDKQLLARCPVAIPRGYPNQIFVSPYENMVVIKWYDQCESALVFLRIDDENDQPLGASFPDLTNLSTNPVFLPDRPALAIAWQEEWDWWLQTAELDHDAPIREGECLVGFVRFFDWQTQTFTDSEITTILEKGWVPPPDEEALIRDLVLVDAQHLALTLPYHVTKLLPIPASI